MSSAKHDTPTHGSGHGTTASYVRGFILSLAFTFIPYFLVFEYDVSRNVLIATILAFAVLQMLVQLLFFLHLGREKKPHWQLIFLVSTVGIILVVVGGSLIIIHNLRYNMAKPTSTEASQKLVEGEGIAQINGAETGACESRQNNHKIVIEDGQVTPQLTEAQKCDSLTFVNKDGGSLHLNFGTYPEQQVYSGETELTARKTRAASLTLLEAGTYTFYDQANPGTSGTFTVAP